MKLVTTNKSLGRKKCSLLPGNEKVTVGRCCHEKLTNSNCRDSVGFGDQMQFRHLVEMWFVAFQAATLTILLQLW